MRRVIVFMSVWCQSKDGAVRAVYARAGQFAALGVGVANQSRVRALLGGLVSAVRRGVIGLVGFVMVEGVMEMKACLGVARIACLLGIAGVAGMAGRACLGALASGASVGGLAGRARGACGSILTGRVSMTCVGALAGRARGARVSALASRACRVALARVFCRYLVSSPDSMVSTWKGNLVRR